MRILFISSCNMIATNLAYLMKQEGHEVKLFIDDKESQTNFNNIVEKSSDWKKDLEWVGKGENSLVVFDDIDYGKIQEDLRAEGYSVFGGCELGDKLESDRQYAQEIFLKYGIKTVPIKNFPDIDTSINFVKKNKNAWVIKQNGCAAKNVNYVGRFDDGRDLIDVLENYEKNLEGDNKSITLQQRIQGVEIAVSRLFNGEDWVGPIYVNVEHKKFFPGDLGPTTSEMGTLVWCEPDEKSKLFAETLSRLKPHLQKIKYRGMIDLNCIVDQTGAYPLEASPRFGSPIVYAQTELNKSPWAEILKAVADGKDYDLKTQKGYSIVVLVTVPPFPYTKKLKQLSPKGLNIYFSENVNEKSFSHIHFEGVAVKKNNGKSQYYISDDQGYILYLTAVGHSVETAQKKVYNLAKEIFIPKMFYRNDIGNRFLESSYDDLRRWGYL